MAINFLNLSSEVHTDTLDMKNKGKIETDLTVTETWKARHEMVIRMTIDALEIHATGNYARIIDGAASSDLLKHNPTVPDKQVGDQVVGASGPTAINYANQMNAPTGFK